MLLRYRIASWVLAHRTAAACLFILITIFFALGLPRVELKTVFSDLLPKDDPFVQVFRDHPDFGSPLTMLVMVRHTDGDIYNTETINKVWQLTRDIDLAPAVDHAQILSIATTKARYAQASPYGIDMRPLMGDAPPKNAGEIALFRERVRKAPKVSKFLISKDETATMISAKFIEHRLDYGETFEYVQALVEAARDENHEVHLSGHPALTGWVYRYEWQMAGIFAVTVAALLLALAFYMQNLVGVVAPIVTGGTAAIWAFGLVGWLNIPIEPLLMIVPLLLIARSFSHCVQFTERFYEVYADVGDRQKAAETTMGVMMAPSIVSILTDILGIVVVIAAPIDAMVRHAIFCGMWAVWLIPTGVVLVPLLLTTLPAPGNVHRNARPHRIRRTIEHLLSRIGNLVTGRPAKWTTAVMLVASALVVYTSLQIKIGNPVEGSYLLHHDSEFNTAVRQINDYFPGVNTLEIVLEAKNPEDSNWTAQHVDAIFTALKLQTLMESEPQPPRASLSYADYLTETNRLFNGGNNKWMPLDPNQKAVSAAVIGSMMGASASNYGHVISENMQHATVSFWYADNRQETVDNALASARKAVAEVGVDHPTFTVRLGTGVIALQEAVNRVVERYHWLVLALLNVFILMMCAMAYRSLVAGLILLVPVNLANAAMIAAMHLLGVGLDVNSMIVSAIGLGVGIDYGIYLLSRICEEHDSQHNNWSATINAALGTTGRAIMFTATIMAVGILPWYFLSELKFVADMGLLLVVIMGINMALSLVVLPLLVWLFKPAFISGSHLLNQQHVI